MTSLSTDGPPAVVSLTRFLPVNAAPAAAGWPPGPSMPRMKAILLASGASGASGPTRPFAWCSAGTPPPRKMLNARTGGARGAAHTLRLRISSRNGTAIATPPAPRRKVRRLSLRMYLMTCPRSAWCSLGGRVGEVGAGRDRRDQIGEGVRRRGGGARAHVLEQALIGGVHGPTHGELRRLRREAVADARVGRERRHVVGDARVGHVRAARTREPAVLAHGVPVD